MPPSYSMMLPGRMSTPLIFMSSLGENVGKEPARALAADHFPGKHGVGIDRPPLPPALFGCHRIDGEVEVRPRCACVARMAYSGDHLAPLDLLSLGKTRRIGRKVRVVIHPLLVHRALVEGDSTSPTAEEQLLDRPVGGGDHRSALVRHDVDGVMTSSLGSRRIEGVDELVGLHSDHGYRQA